MAVRVVARFRPLRPGLSSAVELSDASASVKNRQFAFDRVFGPEATQQAVFESVAAPMVADVVAGYNCTVFAYGQTGSGKTHTMLGDAASPGLLPRAARALFEQIPADGTTTVTASFIEIYMERLRDLLDVANGDLRVREARGRGVWVEGCTQEEAPDCAAVLAAVRRGAAARSSGAHAMNAQSSRSHSVFVLTVSRQDPASGVVTTGKLHVVDLAGSEMVRKTAASGQRLSEAKHINRSLSALGNVITALVDGKPHVPYRDSKLTRVLQDSLGGNAKTALIVTCSCAAAHADETLSTLRFGTRATSVRNRPHINAERSPAELRRALAAAERQVASLQAHVAQLTAALTAAGGVVADPPASPPPEPEPEPELHAEEDDPVCRLCEKPGGEVFLCDGNCSSYFHAACAALDEAPEAGEWFCDDCRAPAAASAAELRAELATAVREKQLLEARWRVEREMGRALDAKKQAQRRRTQEAVARLKLDLAQAEEQNALLRARADRQDAVEAGLRAQLAEAHQPPMERCASPSPPPRRLPALPASPRPGPAPPASPRPEPESSSELEREVAILHRLLEERDRALGERESDLRKSRAELAELRQLSAVSAAPRVDVAALAAERSKLDSRAGGMRAQVSQWWAGEEEQPQDDPSPPPAEQSPAEQSPAPEQPQPQPGPDLASTVPAFKTRLLGVLNSLQAEAGSWRQHRERIESENEMHKEARRASFKDLRALREARRGSS